MGESFDGTIGAIRNGADVVNMSFGAHWDENIPLPTTLVAAVHAATSSGVVLVAAAGNSGRDVPCAAGLVLREGDHCTVDIPNINVGTDRFEIRGGSGCLGFICGGTGTNLNGFSASNNGDGTWTVTAVP